VFNPKPIISVFCFVLLACVARGQYYPGGLGNGNLVLWLNANNNSSITKNGANQVSKWSDLSGNGYNFVQATTTQEPVYGSTTGPYNRPALTFTSTSSQYLSTPTLPASISFTAGTSSFAMGSFKAPQTAQGWQRIFDLGDGTASNNLTLGRYGATANLYYESWKGGTGDQTYTTTNPIVNGVDTLYEATQQGGAAGTLSAVAHYLSGTSQADNGAAGSSKTWVPPAIVRTSNYIGRSNWNADNYFSGTLSEILLYNTAFNTTERVIMENYLSAEWGEAISTAKYNPPSSTTYTTNLVGIGYTSAADNFPANPAGSTDGLSFSSGTTAADFLGSPGYLMAAHNGQANTMVTNTAVTGIGTNVDYWNRSWYLNATGGNSGGVVTFNFNFSNYNGSALPGATNYFLVYNSTDGSFASGANQLIAVNTSVAGATVSFAVKGSSLGNGYYTIMWWPSTPGISASASPVCEGGTLTFSAPGLNGCTYQWQVNTGSGFANVPATDPGGAVYSGATSTSLGITGVTPSLNSYTYQLLLTAANGPAITEGPVSPVINPAPSAQALASAANPICAGSGTTLSITTPVPGITYNIYTDPALTVNVGSLTIASNSLAVSPATTTTYYEQAVTTATGCIQLTAAQNVTLTVNPVPAAQPLALAANPICAGSGTTLSITTPVPGITYNIYTDPALTINIGSLTTASNSLAVSPATTTTYYEQAVTTAAGCVQTAPVQSLTLTVNPAPAAQPLAASANPICAGSSTTLSITTPAAGVTYNIYSDPALTINIGSLTSAANSLAVSPATTTTYYEQAVDGVTGCVQTAANQNITVTVNPVPAAQPLAASANPICAGSSTTLSITTPAAGVTYNIYSDPALTINIGSLTSAANSLAVSPATTTTYYEQAVTTATGCIQLTAAQNVTLTVNTTPQLTTTANLILCNGSPDTLSAAAPNASITWQGYSAQPSIIVSPTTTTTYTVTAQTAVGCADTATLTVQVVDFKLSLTASPDPVTAGFPVNLSTNANQSYQVLSWLPESQFPDQTASSQTFTIIDTSKTYSVVAESVNGCIDTATVTVTVATNTGDLFIPNAFTPNGDGKNDLFKVYGSSINQIELRIFNQWGQLLFESKDPQRGWDGTYGGHPQPTGVYLYAVKLTLYGQPSPIIRKGSLNLIR
jgi:gliding motility-associated-like protein